MKEWDVFEVMMVRNELGNLPVYSLPFVFQIKAFMEGDQDTWVKIHQITEDYHSINHELYYREFGTDLQKLSDRQFFVCDQKGRAVGTATAWEDNEIIGQGFGRIHWVAVLPEFQGRGLAKALTSEVCQRFQKLGYNKALVTTENFRLNAIHIYRKFGFEPFPRNETEKQFWEFYSRQIGKP